MTLGDAATAKVASMKLPALIGGIIVRSMFGSSEKRGVMFGAMSIGPKIISSSSVHDARPFVNTSDKINDPPVTIVFGNSIKSSSSVNKSTSCSDVRAKYSVSVWSNVYAGIVLSCCVLTSPRSVTVVIVPSIRGCGLGSENRVSGRL